MKKIVLKAVAALTEKSLKVSANTACFLFTYQPKAPAELKKFKK